MGNTATTILITGGDSMLASYLARAFGDRAEQFNRQQLDITDTAAFKKIIDEHQFEAVINTVGTATGTEKELFNINARAPGEMAKWCAENNILFIFLSTGRVFDGAQATPYVESDLTNPLDNYGNSKLAGENLVSSALRGKPHYIIRLPMILGMRRTNNQGQILQRLLKLAKDRPTVDVANDVIHSPLHAREAGTMIKECLDQKHTAGLYHCSASDSVSLFDLTAYIFQELGIDCTVNPVPHRRFHPNGRFPAYQALGSEKIKAGHTWQQAANAFVQEYRATP